MDVDNQVTESPVQATFRDNGQHHHSSDDKWKDKECYDSWLHGSNIKKAHSERRRTLGRITRSLFSNKSTEECSGTDVWEESSDDSDEFTNSFSSKLNSTDCWLESRYHQDFYEIKEIGKGEFGSVYKCINKLDGCTYAVKKTRQPICGSSSEKRALNEVYAHAVLGKHNRVVRYYSAWTENNHMYIQNEFCNGGSLAEFIDEIKSKNETFVESQLKTMLLHVAQGLKYIHSQNLVHLDIKPGNIFLIKNEDLLDSSMGSKKTNESSDDGFEDENDSENDMLSEISYKIGDLGLVTSTIMPHVEEGDCRYLAREILQENYSSLPKADIFALGLTIYEVARGFSLPKNGEEWHELRSNQIPYLTKYSDEFNQLIKKMVNSDPSKRPSSDALVGHPYLISSWNKSKLQLRKELNAEKLKTLYLSRQLEEAVRCLNGFPNKTSTPLLKSKISRSLSSTIF